MLGLVWIFSFASCLQSIAVALFRTSVLAAVPSQWSRIHHIMTSRIHHELNCYKKVPEQLSASELSGLIRSPCFFGETPRRNLKGREGTHRHGASATWLRDDWGVWVPYRR